MFSKIESLISGMLPFIATVIVGMYLTVGSGFFQFRHLRESITTVLGGVFNKKKDIRGITPFQAVCTALSATVGTGNIVGVAGAVSIGGAGAIFWMWISALFGMAVKFFEIVLSVHYRDIEDKSPVGGPMYYIVNGLPSAFAPLALLFSFCGIFSTACTSNLTQANTAVNATSGNFKIKLVLGAAAAIITAAVLLGGAKRIAAFTEKIVPFMAIIYIIFSFGVIFVNLNRLPAAVLMIFEGAFCPSAVTGGAIGSAITVMQIGASRGIFSNEAGLGTSAMAHASADTDSPVRQGLYGIFEVFADTIVLCTLTGLVLLCSDIEIIYGVELPGLALQAFRPVYGQYSGAVLALMLWFFALSSIIGGGFFVMRYVTFLWGKKAQKPFLAAYSLSCIAGAVCSVSSVWRLAAFFNGIMVCINLFAVMLLSHSGIELAKKYDIEKKQKK